MRYSADIFIEQAKEQNKSSEFIEAGTNYIRKLDEGNYPVIFSNVHLSQLIGIQSSYLSFLIDTRNSHYNYFKLRKKISGFREIMAPDEKLKYIQKWIDVNIVKKHSLNPSCLGFRKKKSIVHNAKIHQNANIILKVDLLKFYDTITEKRVFGMFKSMGYAKNLAFDLAKLTTAKHRNKYWSSFTEDDQKTLAELVKIKPPVLPQGSPSSPTISNIIANNLDKRFSNYSNIIGCEYSRYADDLTFSVKNLRTGKLPSLKLIRKIISDEGFYINNNKIKFYKRGVKQYVTGLTVTNDFNVSKKYRKEIIKHLYYAKVYGPTEHLKRTKIKGVNDQSNPSSFQDWLMGNISFIHSVNKNSAKKMFADFNKIDWSI